MDKETITKHYTNGEITVVWQPARCIHSTICWKGIEGLPQVFNPRERPWINMKGSTTGRIVEQVNKCPSGALSFFYNKTDNDADATEVQVKVLHNGPLVVHGKVLVQDASGKTTRMGNVTAFCRCGLSGNKPYCDGSHVRTALDGQESAKSD